MLYLSCRYEYLLSASRKCLEAARVCAVAERISTFASTTLKTLLATTLCGAAMAVGVATICPPIRVRTAHGADFRINWPRPCKARARGGEPVSGRESGKMSSDTTQTGTTPFALPFIGGAVLAVPCRYPRISGVYVPHPVPSRPPDP